MSDENLHYEESFVSFLEALWGDGYLSPGGPEEVARLLADVDLAGRSVLDIGCGSGGITLSLAKTYGAGEVIGVDVEAPVCQFAQNRIEKAGFQDRVEIRQISTEYPMPFPDGRFDIVFSKDSIVHIPDKEVLCHEAFRLLKPGGWFVASDWLISHDGEPSPEMAAYIKMEDIGFGMASPARYQTALNRAGFINIELNNRNRWYYGVAQTELARLEGEDRHRFVEIVGEEETVAQTDLWKAMLGVLATGEHCPHHFRGQKPDSIR